MNRIGWWLMKWGLETERRSLYTKGTVFLKYLNRKKRCLFVCSWIRKSITLFKVIYLSPMAKRDGEREWQRTQHQGRRRKKKREAKRRRSSEKESLSSFFFFFLVKSFSFYFLFFCSLSLFQIPKNFNSFGAILNCFMSLLLVSYLLLHSHLHLL